MYHGTTLARWEIGIKHEGLKGNMPARLKVDKEHLGHVYLCDNIQDSAFYSLLTWAFDATVPSLRDYNEKGKAGVILAISTSHLRKEIEVDPEYAECLADYEKEFDPQRFDLVKKIYMNGLWYRLKGDIPSKAIVPLKIVPIDKQDPLTMEVTTTMASEKVFEEKIMDLVMSYKPKPGKPVQLK
jgi:hypothetical protein